MFFVTVCFGVDFGFVVFGCGLDGCVWVGLFLYIVVIDRRGLLAMYLLFY